MRTQHAMARYHFWYATIALFIAALCIVCGTILFLAGITGSVSWVVTGPGVSSNLTNAGPGLILVIIGFLIIYVTRLRL